MIGYNLNLIKLSSACAKTFDSNELRLDIIWSIVITSSSFIVYFEQVYYEILFSLKYLNFLYQLLITRFYKDSFMEM